MGPDLEHRTLGKQHGRILDRDLALLRRMMILAVQEKKLQFTILHSPMTSEKGNTRKGFVDLPSSANSLTLCRNICVPICCSIMPVPIFKELRAMLKKLFRGNGPVFDTCNFRKTFVIACVAVGFRVGRSLTETVEHGDCWLSLGASLWH